MRMRQHGTTVYRSTPFRIQDFANTMSAAGRAAKQLDLALPPAEPGPEVDFMFGDLTVNPDNRIPETDQTLAALRQLGLAMASDPDGEEGNIPAAYTYFGQFIDHDITKTAFAKTLQPAAGKDLIENPDLQPLDRHELPLKVFNDRSPRLDLDSVYDGAAEQTIGASGRFNLGVVSASGFFPIATADRFHDVPRMPQINTPMSQADLDNDRRALIGDPRNDENLLVAQLHVAFLRAHNTLIDRGLNFAGARTAMRRRYQWAVLHDFLSQICDADVISDVLGNGASAWKVTSSEALFMPVEFSAAAYRFGHSMIRAAYSHNATFGPKPPAKVAATFNRMFTFTALSGEIPNPLKPGEEFPTLPDNWTIEWHRFFESADLPVSENPARRIDTRLTPELGKLPDNQGVPFPKIMASLAARNLLRGYLLGLPTGQAVADRLGVARLAENVLRDAVPAALQLVITQAGFFARTPLWFYLLAEAGDPAGANGKTLGIVGSRIVAETLWNCVRFSEDSVITTPPTADELATGEFTLRGIVKMGQDLNLPAL